MTKKSSYQKLKDRVQELTEELYTVCNEEDSGKAIGIKVKYQLKKSFEDAIMFGECKMELPDIINGDTESIKMEGLGIYNRMQENHVKLLQKREYFLIKHIEKLGFKFDTPQELQKFLKERCELVIIQGTQKKIFKVDNKTVLEFDDTVQIEDVSNNPIKISLGGIYETNK